MKLLWDVHIPFKLVRNYKELSYETKHVNELQDKWFTSDKDICTFCDTMYFVIITKYKDFKNSYLIKKEPKMVIKINLGNVSTAHIISLFNNNIADIAKLDV